MEVLAVVLLVLAERARVDLPLRRWWSRSAVSALLLSRPAMAGSVPVPVALAGLDVRRWTVRLTTAGVAVAMWMMYAQRYELDPYHGVNRLVGFYLAFVGLGVLAIVAAVGGRDRGAELLEALPAGPRSRVLGAAALVGVLAAVEYGVLLAARYGRELPWYDELLPGPWELAHGPLMLLGGGLLGLLLARLLPGWLSAPIGVVLGVAWVAYFTRSGSEWHMLAPLVEWIQYHESGRVVVEPGSLAWNNAFLLGLCGLGVVAALLREPGRRRGLVLAGGLLLTATVVAGSLALP